MNAKRKPYMLTNQNSTAYWLIDNLWMPLATSHHTQDNFSLMEQVCGTGIGGPQTHMHPTDEGMYILEGHITFQVGGEQIKAEPGTFASIPRLTEHSFTIDKVGTRVLNFYTPGGFEMFIMSLGIPAPERKSPKPGTTPMPARWMAMEASREFGQLPGSSMPLADPPNKENSKTKPSELNPIKPFATTLKKAPAFWVQSSLCTLLCTQEQVGGSYSLIHQHAPRGAGPATHAHKHDEGIYVLEGEITLAAGTECFEAQAGSFLYIPGSSVHSFRVDSGEAKLLKWNLPGGYEKYITAQGVPAKKRELPGEYIPTRLSHREADFLSEQLGLEWMATPDALRS